MKWDGGTLATLAGSFALMSLFAIGGANSAVPEMHRLAVDVKHWMTDQQFTDTFALAQVIPGPNMIIVTLIGYHVAGIAGACITTLAMCGPTCLLAFIVGRTIDRFGGASWQEVLHAGLVPLSLGLIASSAAVVARAADHNWVTAGISVASAIITYRQRLHPLWVFAAAALIGLTGLA
ncbi:MAG: chromate transporter [Hyphomicrobiales bacterium]|nr:chromate transporter [Hyphomicrobiales bacterium]MDE2285891.1 chromate transporter [Hyphomicrobiales bacterium]MDE2372849.1 chromate transporter [Hyphomicrobiales bacterium]